MSAKTYRRVGNLPFPGIYLGQDAHTNHYGERWETLHVMSAHAGGQVHGYHRLHGESSWRVWLPAYAGHWPEMDRAVADLVGETVIGLDGVPAAIPSSQLALPIGDDDTEIVTRVTAGLSRG